MPKSSGKKSPVISALRIAKSPCPVCKSEYRSVRVYESSGLRVKGTKVVCYMNSKHKLGKGKAAQLSPRVKLDRERVKKQLIALGIDPKGVTFAGYK